MWARIGLAFQNGNRNFRNRQIACLRQAFGNGRIWFPDDSSSTGNTEVGSHVMRSVLMSGFPTVHSVAESGGLSRERCFTPGRGLESVLRIPGHEVAGIIDAVGPGVKGGQRVTVSALVGMGRTALHACRKGDFANCANLLVCGLSYDGGYQEYMIAPIEALRPNTGIARSCEAAPLMCTGITTFDALRHSGAVAGDLVAVQGVGGLGHLGIQFAKKSGYLVAAVGRGTHNGQSHKNSERIFLSTALAPTLRPNCRSWVVQASCSPPH